MDRGIWYWHRRNDRLPVTITVAATWLLFIYAGYAAIFYTPRTIMAQVGAVVPFWGGLLIVGGIVGFVGCALIPHPWWRYLERFGIYFSGAGTLIYAVTVFYLGITESGYRQVQFAFILIAMGWLVSRYVRLGDTNNRDSRRSTDVQNLRSE